MKTFKIFTISSLFVLLACSCRQIIKVTDVITQPSAREIYARDFKEDSLHFAHWQQVFELALQDSTSITLPYLESGRFDPDLMAAAAYRLHLEQGEVLHVRVERADDIDPVFLDLFDQKSDSLNSVNGIVNIGLKAHKIDFTVKKSGDYKLVVQPGIKVSGSFYLKVYRTPLYHFPVAGKDNAAIQSFWGANRDAGRRSHEGLDIFADRGTPVVAAADGWISSTGNRGLGGKQVWLRAGLFGNSLYYAHLDSIAVGSGKRVKLGDTLGFVGNTGNARTTPPHLHFGIYQGRRGAINPLPYVYMGKAPLISEQNNPLPLQVRVRVFRANLRAAASAKAQKVGQISHLDTLSVLGKSQDWLHIRTLNGKAAYIYENLTEALGQ